MDSVLSLTSDDRAQLFQESAARLGVSSAIIVEKDFWVSWLLKQVFDGAQSEAMVFKGGTSLSKAFQLIKRFSEDCDIAISRQRLGFNETVNEVADFGSKRRKRYFDALHQTTSDFIHKELHPKLSSKCEADLPTDWALEIDEHDPQVINFAYPRSLLSNRYPEVAYIRPIVKLEFGSRGSTSPAKTRMIHSYVKESFPDICSDVTCKAPVLEPSRTFWEKVTLLHQLAHWPANKPIKKELARHYYDVLMLAGKLKISEGANNLDMLIEVANHKTAYFRDPKAFFETARPGTLKILPNTDRIKTLKDDYQNMREMFFEEPPPFEEMIDFLKTIENAINGNSRR